jgi:NAD(P)-dependent dehydrogenase (short-subunit alcohol dehydrogenase family)
MANDAQITGLGGVMITGASSGIGKTCAIYLDQRGYRVFAGVRKAADGEALTAAAPRVRPLIVDVTDQQSVAGAAEQVKQALGETPLAGLVNNAGIGLGGPAEFLALSDMRRQMEVNLVGQLGVIQAFMPMLRRSRGRIVNISSVGGRAATPFLAPYCASKFALEALSDCLRVEVKPWGIKVAVVEPGAIQTSIWDKSRNTVEEVTRSLPPEGLRLYGEEIGRMRVLIAMQERMAIPAERVAAVVAHALSARRPRTRYLVGFDAKVMALLHWLLPDRAYDAVLAMMMRRMSKGETSAGEARSQTTPS